jgi:hypothetical protein
VGDVVGAWLPFRNAAGRANAAADHQQGMSLAADQFVPAAIGPYDVCLQELGQRSER